MTSEDQVKLSVEQLNLARQLLRLEQQLEAFIQLNDDELEQLHSSLDDCKKKFLSIMEVHERELLHVPNSNNHISESQN